MSLDAVISALAIPQIARVDKRIPKKLLLEQAACGPSDRRSVQDLVDDIQWIAALKPTNIGVHEYRDETHEYLEVAVVTLKMKEPSKSPRIAQLVHRAIPYPVLLMIAQESNCSVSLAHKRISQASGGKFVLDYLQKTSFIDLSEVSLLESAFINSLAISELPSGNLFFLYQAWLERVLALELSQITKSFIIPHTTDQSNCLRQNLDKYYKLKQEIKTVRARAVREKQLNKRVDLNSRLRELEQHLESLTEELVLKEP